MEWLEIILDFIFPYDPNVAINDPSLYDNRPYSPKYKKNYTKEEEEDGRVIHSWDDGPKDMVSIGEQLVMDSGEEEDGHGGDLVKEVARELLRGLVANR